MSSSPRILWWQNGHYYQFIDESKSWSNAAKAANSEFINGWGFGSLASPTYWDENNFIWQSVIRGYNSNAHPWIAATDSEKANRNASEGNWVWGANL